MRANAPFYTSLLSYTDLYVVQFRRSVAVYSVEPVRKCERASTRNYAVVSAVAVERIIVNVQIQLRTARDNIQ